MIFFAFSACSQPIPFPTGFWYTILQFTVRLAAVEVLMPALVSYVRLACFGPPLALGSFVREPLTYLLRCMQGSMPGVDMRLQSTVLYITGSAAGNVGQHCKRDALELVRRSELMESGTFGRFEA